MNVRNGRDYIVTGLQAFDSPIGSNCVNIAHEIARHNRVLYINYPLDLKTYFRANEEDAAVVASRKAVLNGNRPELVQHSENMWVLTPKTVLASINWMKDGSFYDLLNKRNNYTLAKRIKRALAELDFKDYFLFNDSDMFRSFYLKELLQPEAYIYYSRDNLITQPYFAKHGKRLEAELIAKADLATANSLYLRDYCQEFNPQSFYVGQGCETELFDPDGDYELPEDIAHIKQPIIGYIGALLKIRLDVELLEKLAAKNPQWHFLLVGPEDEAFKNSSLHQAENVTFTGPKKPEELPRYLHFFDVAMNPQALNELTIGNYPRKIDEYLAMGKATVATLTRAMEIFEDHVYLAKNYEEYQKFIEQALKENSEASKKERIKFAHNHTWETSVGEIYDAIEKVSNP